MATNTFSRAYVGGVYAHTAEAVIKEVRDIQFNKNLMWAALMDKNKLSKYTAAGRSIIAPIDSGTNPTLDWRDLTSQIPLDQYAPTKWAEHPWADLSGACVFYDKIRKQNTGKAQIINWVERVIRNTMLGIKLKGELAFTSGYGEDGDENGVSDNKPRMRGLKSAVTDGTHARSNTAYGGITTANEPNWASYMKQSSGLDQLPADLLDIILTLEGRTGSPDVLWTDQFLYSQYHQSLKPSVRLTSLKVGDLEFQGLDFRGIPMMFDPNITPITTATLPTNWTGTVDGDSTHRCYALTLEDWALAQMPDWEWSNPIESKEREPNDQFAMSRLIGVESNAICLNRRSQSCLWGVAES